ncbi:MAG: S41 family peptidase [Lachnospiraceae bacterium]|nr:S41 family peptidase [Lachnospiraceae bacterium]
MKGKNVRIFLTGLGTGILFFAAVIVITKYAGIHLFSNGSLADDVWERAKVVEKYIDDYYWKEDISDQRLSESAAKGMVAGLGDKYSTYFTEEEYNEAMNNVNGDYCGIGASLRADTETGRKYIAEVQSGQPAERAGVMVGDELRAVNGTDVVEKSLTETVALIKGEEGKKSVLTLVRTENGNAVTKEITVVCEKIVTQSITSRMLPEKFGYIKISSFNNESVKQFEEAIRGLESQGQKGMIIDVRNNGGGSLTATVDMLDRLLPAGRLITEESRGSGDKVYESTDEEHFDKPMVVLINGNSASASEVFAGTLQDREAAVLVGEKSFGKGIVQTIYSLQKSCGGGLKLTTGEYLLPSGRSIHEVGLTPDVEEKYTGAPENYGGAEDNQLQKAMETLNQKISGQD